MKLPISAQINLAPVDLLILPSILPHQLRTFSHLCQEVVLTLETKMSEKSRWTSSKWNENLTEVQSLVKDLQEDFPNCRLAEIDYSDEKIEEVSRFFLGKGKSKIPLKDFRGGPSYSYLYGLFETKCEHIFHMDSDIIFHGKADQWLKEALEILQKNENIFLCAPLGGPPKYDGALPKIHKKRYNPVSRFEELSYAYMYQDVSTRLYMTTKDKIRHNYLLIRPHLEQIVKAWIRGTEAYHTPERGWSAYIKKTKKYRLDFLPENSEFWSYHFPPTSLHPEFIPLIEISVEKIEKGFYTEDQRGSQEYQHDFIKGLRQAIAQKNPS